MTSPEHHLPEPEQLNYTEAKAYIQAACEVLSSGTAAKDIEAHIEARYVINHDSVDNRVIFSSDERGERFEISMRRSANKERLSINQYKANNDGQLECVGRITRFGNPNAGDTKFMFTDGALESIETVDDDQDQTVAELRFSQVVTGFRDALEGTLSFADSMIIDEHTKVLAADAQASMPHHKVVFVSPLEPSKS